MLFLTVKKPYSALYGLRHIRLDKMENVRVAIVPSLYIFGRYRLTDVAPETTHRNTHFPASHHLKRTPFTTQSTHKHGWGYQCPVRGPLMFACDSSSSIALSDVCQ